ncbi:Tetratricopeptide repeat-containing protein [Enhydrobacter aerosaccus]|uniref:Tetratricopeptide repeat-containing protein n=1 Tax=Enhydrobacter aerosaccus TaxID=225324 RepID=A0A1T4L9A4_9HYPH|nr:tetratricopeptide repeat protein [Enhydrobacter aerosaccus]SJZ51362.1 Tetratricopeptide repeat-containing protein [Enhydrobacter aerosaccus]
MSLPLVSGMAITTQAAPSSTQSQPQGLALPARPPAPAPAPAPALRQAYDAAFQETLLKPADAEVLTRFAKLAVQLGDIEGAISALERLLLVEGDLPDVKLELGVLYFRLGSTEAARTYLQAARSSSQASNEVKDRADAFLKAMASR